MAWSLNSVPCEVSVSLRNSYSDLRYETPRAARSSPAGSVKSLPCVLASQISCLRLARVLRSEEIASMQSWVTGVDLLNGSNPLVQVAKFAPNPAKGELLKPAVRESKPLPQSGEVITALNRSSEATPVDRKSVV